MRGADLDGVCGVCLTARPGVDLTDTTWPLIERIGEEEEEKEEEEAGLGAALQNDTTSHSFEAIVEAIVTEAGEAGEAGEEVKVVVG